MTTDVWIDTLKGHVEAILGDAARLTGVTDEKWAAKPKAGEWSLAQIVDHLNITGEAALERLEPALKEVIQSQWKRTAPPKHTLPERLFIKFVSPNPPFRMPVPPAFEPKSEALDPAVILPAFLTLQERLIQFLDSCGDWDLQKVTVASPASDKLKFRASAYLEGSIAHERYHWEQVKERLKAG